ncbi:MAG: 3,4-dihydroxy-2-butanone-4-phosphate synthase [Methanomassiliicoccaceae archaeon]|nr:3,4-dihydroxy-2-butanone-4-phosphate synthase [Methanomassiliicoccaceae archaeon]
MSLKKAVEDIRNGKLVLVYDFDDRERETDMTIASLSVTPEIIRTMRKDAGGLICTTTPYGIARELGLPFMSDVFFDDSDKYPLLKAMAPTDIPYDNTRSSFGLTINLRSTYTGITDRDRAMTIAEYANTIFSERTNEEKKAALGNKFRAPGHVHLLNTSEKILENRKGHTELTTALMIMAGVPPSATICEMMGDDGNAMSKDDVKKYASKNGYAFAEGDEILKEWNRRKR